MASLSKRKNGIWEIQFLDQHGKRKTITLSGAKFTEQTIEQLRQVIETLVYYRDNMIETCDKRTKGWIETASRVIQQKLDRAGLIQIPKEHTLKELWNAATQAKEQEVRESTMNNYDHSRRRFFEFFKPHAVISDVTKELILQWKDSMGKSQPGKQALSGPTIAGTVSNVKAVFNWAIRNGWLDESPLRGIGKGSFVNREKDRFVRMENYDKLLDACPCQDWRAIIALTRIGGLRSPSEVLALRWEDVLWDKNRFYVTSSKTKHIKGKEGRWVPLFPELRKILDDLFFHSSSEGKEFVINRYRDPKTSLGTQFARIAKRAGLEPIPRPFDNMRASRSTEVYHEFGAFKESKWIGHTTKVAHDHYLQMRDEDYELAAGGKIITPNRISDALAISATNVKEDDPSVLL